MPRQQPWRRIAVALALALPSPTAAAADLDRVELDLASGVLAQRLPFDVPFVIEGQAPPSTSWVEVRYEVRRRAKDAYGVLTPEAGLRSGVDAQGRFRVQMPALPPNRQVRFHVAVERRLAGGGAVRAGIEDVLRVGLPLGAGEPDSRQLAELRAAILARYDSALAPGAVGLPARGLVERREAGALLDPQATEDAAARELKSLGHEVWAADAERRDALERFKLVARSLEGQLAAVAGSSDLAALLVALEARPETDPRNASGRLALSSTARRLAGLEAEARAAVAAGRAPQGPAVGLEGALVPEDAEAVAQRFHATAAGLQELREWLQGLVLPSGDNRHLTDELLRAGSLPAGAPESLRELAGRPQGALHRAERWAEAQAAVAREVARSLRAHEQALSRMAGALEARALALTQRQTIVTEPATTEAGLYVGLDLGVLYPPELDRASLYIGANLYFRPVNKRASLRTHGSLGHRFALTVGISLNDLKLEEGDPRFEPLLGERSNLLVGAGLRISRSLRVSAGALLFLENDKNPLVEDRSLAATFYAALSFDVDVVRVFRAMGQ